jgi:hypothetical protein
VVDFILGAIRNERNYNGGLVMTLDQLHQRYGQLMIQLEIVQNQVMECKKLIAEEMNKPVKPIESKEE